MRGRERTPQEREQARLEREARRAAREGRPPADAPPPMEVPPPPIPPEPPPMEVPPPPIPPEPPPPEIPHPSGPEPSWDEHDGERKVEAGWEGPEEEPDTEPGWEGHEAEPEGEPEWQGHEAELEGEPEWEGHEAELEGEPEWEGHEAELEGEPHSSGRDPEHDVLPEVEPHSGDPDPQHDVPLEAAPHSDDLRHQPEDDLADKPEQGGQRPHPPRPQPPPPFQPAQHGRGARAPTEYGGRAAAAGRSAAARELLIRRREALAGGGGRERRTSGRRLAWLLPLGAIALVALWFLTSLFQPFAGKGEGEGQVQVVIPKGAGVGEIADLLAGKGVVSSGFFFGARARLSGHSGDLKPGTFRLRKHMSHAAALDPLAQGAPPDIVRVTVPEGRARREVKGLVGKQLEGDYLGLTQRSRLLDPKRYGAKRARDLEGFLFPATYDLKRGRPIADLVALQLRAFKRDFPKVDLSAARRRNLTAYDVLTIASMVDREAQLPKERPIIASVIYNRLREGIPLGIDATIRFAINNWSRPLRRSEIEVDSPYNTRQRKGLPPGPIGSPGLAAIRAAARPASTGFLYYVVKPGTCGEHAFTRTAAEFDRDVGRYKTARERLGGKSPTNC